LQKRDRVDTVVVMAMTSRTVTRLSGTRLTGDLMDEGKAVGLAEVDVVGLLEAGDKELVVRLHRLLQHMPIR